MSASLRETRDRYCSPSADLEPPDPDLVAVFDALDAVLALAAMWEADPSAAVKLRGSKVKWTVGRHVMLP